MDAVGIERADRHDLLNFGDTDLAAGRRGLVEVARGLAEHEVPGFVRLPTFDDTDVRADAALEHVGLAVEFLLLLALRDLSADAGLSVEAGNSRSTRAHPLGERALGVELDLDLTRQELPLE